MLGVAYKADVADVRESPALDVIQLLARRGGIVDFHDPHVSELTIEDGRTLKSVELTDKLLESSDMVVILTDHSAVDTPHVVEKARKVFDTRNATRGLKTGDKLRRL